MLKVLAWLIIIRDATLMAKKQDTITYEFKQSNEVVYVGTTNNPEQRERGHKDDEKKFCHMNITSRRITEDSAWRK